MRKITGIFLAMVLLTLACGPATAASGDWVRVNVVKGGKSAPSGLEPPKVERLPGGKEVFSSSSWFDRVKKLERAVDAVVKTVMKPFRKGETARGPEVIVSLSDPVVLDRVLKVVPEAKVKQHLPGDAVLLELPGYSLGDALYDLKHVGGVRYVQPNFTYSTRPVMPTRPVKGAVSQGPVKPTGFLDRVRAGFGRTVRAVGRVV